MMPKPESISVSQWLATATTNLSKVGIPSARLDCLVLLERTLSKDKASLLANSDEILSNNQLTELNQKLEKRQSRTPLAYIIGKKEFYGLDFKVTPAVLIPRPETEDIVTLFETLKLPSRPKIADIGTGSGNIAITIAKRHQTYQLFAYDISSGALSIAKQNAKNHNVDITFKESDLLSGIDQQFDVIIANLPYVDRSIAVSPEVEAEPDSAIFASENGLKLIGRLIDQINDSNLQNKGWLILESHIEQHPRITKLCAAKNLSLFTTQGLIQVFRKH